MLGGARVRGISRPRGAALAHLDDAQCAAVRPLLRLHHSDRDSTRSCFRAASAPATTVGILLAAGVIAGAWVLTAVYVVWANRHYDPDVARLRRADRGRTDAHADDARHARRFRRSCRSSSSSRSRSRSRTGRRGERGRRATSTRRADRSARCRTASRSRATT